MKELIKAWPELKDYLSFPHSEKEYDELVRRLDVLIDEVDHNDDHPLAGLVETMGVLIYMYEEDCRQVKRYR